MIDDAELLRRYAEENSQAAFATLVERHIDFVYAAALRQVHGNASFAQDVTQTVFADVARKAAKLARHRVFVGWLHTAARFAAAKTIRSERRRQTREQQAQVMNDILREADSPIDWERLYPVLDEVLGELKERERLAILLRFFEKQPLTGVAKTLSLTEPAARSCLDRALDKMREQLARRGVTSTTAALMLAMANQTTVAAPAGLVAAIVSAPAAAVTGGGIFTLMSTIKSTVGIVVLAAVVGFGVSERSERVRAQTRLSLALEEGENLQLKLAAALGKIALVEQRAAKAEAHRDANPSKSTSARENLFEDALAVWIAKVDKLSNFLHAHPELRLPGMEALAAEDWLDATKSPQFQSEADFRQALALLRGKIRQKTAPEIGKALKEATAANGGQVPAEVQALAAYLPAEFSPAVLQQLELNPSGEIDGLKVIGGGAGRWVLVDRPLDLWDAVSFYSKDGGVGSRFISPAGEHSIRKAIAQYTQANGVAPENVSQLADFPGIATVPRSTLDQLFQAITTKP